MAQHLSTRVHTKALTVTVQDAAHPALVATFTYSGDRRWPEAVALVGFAVGPAPAAEPQTLTVTAIRDLPAARWQSAAYAALVIRLREVLRGTERPIAAYHKDTPRATKSMSRLLLVAYAYRLNVAAGMRDPVATIAREYQVKPSTAASWVFRARKAGLIGPAAGRTAGEAPQHRRSEK